MFKKVLKPVAAHKVGPLALIRNEGRCKYWGSFRSCMPKIKTNRTAKKKFSINKKGKIKRGGAHHSHKTANKSPKQRRNLRKRKIVESVDAPAIRRQLPYA